MIAVDEHDTIIGLRPSKDVYEGKCIHRAAHLVLFNPKDEILLQKRAEGKRWYPGLYTCSVSGTVEDESYEQCIKREMKEELGISVPVKFAFKFLYEKGTDRAFHSVFVGRTDGEVKPDYYEMTEVKWITLDGLRADVKLHPEKYTPPFAEGIRKYWRLIEAKK